jgi:late competence protein required for DNA uptake (superfamily II DNA/RNA helicase)
MLQGMSKVHTCRWIEFYCSASVNAYRAAATYCQICLCLGGVKEIRILVHNETPHGYALVNY